VGCAVADGGTYETGSPTASRMQSDTVSPPNQPGRETGRRYVDRSNHQSVSNNSERHGRGLWAAASPLIRLAGRTFFGLEIERQSDVPPPPFVVAANHYSHFDAPVIGAALRLPVRFLVVADLFGESRLLDWFVLGSGAIPLPRHRAPLSALRAALSALGRGDVVGVFPEGTRVTHWGTLPPKRGAAWLAARTGVPLLPVAVIGTGRVFGLENRLRRGRIRVVIGGPLEGEDPAGLTDRWAEWLTETISDHPGSEVDGPRRAFYDPGMNG